MKISPLMSAVITVAVAACGGSSDKSFDCASICARAKQCNSNVLVDTCQEDCATTASSLVDSAQQAIASCGKGACAETTACQSSAIEECMSGTEDVTPWLDSLCSAATECPSSTVTASQCAASLMDADRASLRCFSAAARQKLLSCALEKCGQPDAILDCGRDVMPLLEELASGFAS